jgi:hypothetical protein
MCVPAEVLVHIHSKVLGAVHWFDSNFRQYQGALWLLLFLCVKSINTSLLNSKQELWLCDHSIAPPGLVVISASMLCACRNVLAVAIRIASSTMLLLPHWCFLGHLSDTHCSIGIMPLIVGLPAQFCCLRLFCLIHGHQISEQCNDL